ncbi:MFS transporter [Tenacibaculum sp. HL-MS23]|uniref:MFS transporter n=1 Tax=Tenacibaculum TaxID=104267 RepID=UPI001C4FD6F7|nr:MULTISPECIES: MFS transporter [Tenacibaculum]QXP73470.1 MFS transporter [Tenacibaculum sp. AHE14PA]QXP74984.1 MFS transporter [Tenacibaculum sp. AHE15PA]WNW01523.1 MFS transporter [Tenacibaculum sp. HL-MS23]
MNQKIKTLKIIHLALIAGVTLAYFLIGDFKNILNLEIDNASLIYSFIPAVAYVLSNFIFKNTLNKIKEGDSDDEKFAIYQSASIFKWAIIEAACFIILLLKPDFILFGVILLFYMILLAPKEDKIYQLLKIKNPEL